MGSLTIRKVDEDLKARLRRRAERHGCSMEQEVRNILRRAVQPAPAETGFTERIRKRYARPEGDERTAGAPRRKEAS